jgi:hypothetical protein
VNNKKLYIAAFQDAALGWSQNKERFCMRVVQVKTAEVKKWEDV